MAITGSRDKRVKTSTFIIDLPGNFLTMQQIDEGKTDRNLLPMKQIYGVKQIEAYSRCN